MARTSRWRPRDFIVNGLATIAFFAVLGIIVTNTFSGAIGLVAAAGALLGVIWLIVGIVRQLIEIAERDG